MSTTYEVIATRSGDWWTVEVTAGLPANVLGVSQAQRLMEVPTVARNLIEDLLEVDPATIDVSLLVQLPSDLDEGLYGALEAAANRSGRSIEALVNEAIASWLADAAADEADHLEIEQARAEAAEQGGAEFEAFFSGGDSIDACRRT